MVRVGVLLAGISTRAMAESAVRAGFSVTALDAFGDLDLERVARCRALPRDTGVRWSATAAARASRGLDVGVVAYGAPFENHARAVRLLAAGRTLWGNGPEVLARVRDPVLVARGLEGRGIAVPAVHVAPGPPPRRHSRAPLWLRKRRASGGGRGVAPWTRQGTLGTRWYLQEWVPGVPGSVTFVAGSGRALILGVSRQLIGEPAFGAQGMRYCGSILAPAADAQFARGRTLHRRATALAQAVTEVFGLVGVGGVDFIAREGVPYPIEVNPRWTASVELVERAHGASVFALHALACRGGPMPDGGPGDRALDHAVGKAVVFARRTVVLGSTGPWLEDGDIRDVPHPGERIRRGSPVCTLLARGRDAAACHGALVRRAAALYRELDAMARRTA
jgi:predicted ATP-grasp superfamily ATP-dependent carboligase